METGADDEIRVAVVGDIYIDLLLKVEELPVWGEDRHASTTLLTPGGSTANTARFLGSLGGVNVTLFSAVGKDALGSYFLEQLRTEGCVETEGTVTVLDAVPTSVCVVMSGPSDRGFVSCNSSNDALKPELLDEARLRTHTHVHFGGFFNTPNMHTPVLTRLMRDLRAAGITMTLDTQYDLSGRWDGKGHLKEALRLVDAFMPNEREAAGVTGATAPKEALERLCDMMRPGALALVKVGERGVLAGAGDAFNAGFVHAFVHRQSPEACLRAGCVAGTQSVQQLGGCEEVRMWAARCLDKLKL